MLIQIYSLRKSIFYITDKLLKRNVMYSYSPHICPACVLLVCVAYLEPYAYICCATLRPLMQYNCWRLQCIYRFGSFTQLLELYQILAFWSKLRYLQHTFWFWLIPCWSLQFDFISEFVGFFYYYLFVSDDLISLLNTNRKNPLEVLIFLYV